MDYHESGFFKEYCMRLPLLPLSVAFACFSCHAINPTYGISVETGMFGTDQQDKKGVVSPWRITGKIDADVGDTDKVSVELVTESGISKTDGPVVHPFTSGDPKALSIGKIKYTRTLLDDNKFALGLGRVKANILKKGGSTTPLAFSNAVNSLPVSSSDVAIGYQLPTSLAGHTLSMGFASDKISSQSVSNDRNHSVFVESYHSFDHVNAFIQYSKNNLGKVYKEPEYVLLGGDYTVDTFTANAAVAYTKDDKVIGYDIGAKLKLSGAEKNFVGIGYSHKKTTSDITEISYDYAVTSSLKMTLSVYHKQPLGSNGSANEKSFFVGGIRFTQELI